MTVHAFFSFFLSFSPAALRCVAFADDDDTTRAKCSGSDGDGRQKKISQRRAKNIGGVREREASFRGISVSIVHFEAFLH